MSIGKTFCHSRARNSKANIPVCPEIRLVRDFMPVLSPASLTKIESQLKVLAWIHHFPQLFCLSRASNSEVNGPIWPEIEFVRDLMPVTSKFDEDPTKNERASLETPFSHYKFMGSRAPNSEGSGPIWPEIELVLVTAKFFITQGQVSPKWMVRPGPKSNSSMLPASLTKIR